MGSGLRAELFQRVSPAVARAPALAFILLLAAHGAQAQLTPALPGSTRALALGNSYPLASAESDVIFYNPAFLNTARGIAGSAAFYGSGARSFGVSGALAWWGGGVGFGLQSLSYGAASATSGAFGRGEAGLSGSGGVAASEAVASAAYARTLFGFRVGVTGKLIDFRVASERDATAAADVGIARSVGPVTLGLAGRNLGRDPSVDGIDAELPTEVTLGGASGTRPLGPLDVMVAASASWRRDEMWAAGGGIEVSYWPIQGRTFTGRAGYRWIEDSDLKPLTLGAGFTGDGIAIDWAVQDVDDGDPVHRLTIRIR